MTRAEIVQHLGEVTAGLALGENGCHKEPCVDQRNPARETVERIG
jgi:hypothetical protein